MGSRWHLLALFPVCGEMGEVKSGKEVISVEVRGAGGWK